MIKIYEERILLPVRLRYTINRLVPVIDDLRIKFFGQISSLGLQHVTHKNPKQFDIVKKKFNAGKNTPEKTRRKNQTSTFSSKSAGAC
ncbi:MAG TPA: hypothetical protein PKJ25_04995 [Smithellaceae bacterium]|nr:hypothetical protein [Smithellaceae bacterium]HOF78292.1 hypothetical protein [Smithellaceae bacterium]HOM69306.1 hypothetical protein [Smithellaceae bacterium]HOS09842.1 hypothetical protein [Smithellaceae bacterium]HOU05142.1 hypothetical protein [Smithellaceae bacterium]